MTLNTEREYGLELGIDYEKTALQVAEQILTEEECPYEAEVSLLLTSDEEILRLNLEYRGIDRPTDVLSFPIFEKDELSQKLQENDFTYEDMLGDIMISMERVKEQAQEYEHSFEREFSYMLVHGFYHLMGYDHIQEEDKKIMRPKEEKILKDLKMDRD